MRLPLRLIFAHSRRTWFRTLLTIGSVFVAVLLFGFLRTFIVSMKIQANSSDDRRLVTRSALSLFDQLPKKLYPEIAAMDGVQAVTHWSWYGGVYISSDPKHFWGRFGVEVPSFREVYGSDMAMPEAQWRRFIQQRTACVIGQDLAASEELQLGSKVPLVGNIFAGRLELEVVGIYESKRKSFDAKTLFMHWDYMNEESKKLGGRSERVSTFTLLLKSGANADAVKRAVDARYESSDSRTLTTTERAFQQQFNSMWGNLPLYFGILGALVLIACLMVTANTMFLNSLERIREIGILKTLGFPPGIITALTLIEGVLLCVAGGALTLPIIRSLDGKLLVFVVGSVPPTTYLECLGISVLLGVISGLMPALMARRLDIVTAIRRTA